MMSLTLALSASRVLELHSKSPFFVTEESAKLGQEVGMSEKLLWPETVEPHIGCHLLARESMESPSGFLVPLIYVGRKLQDKFIHV